MQYEFTINRKTCLYLLYTHMRYQPKSLQHAK